MIKLETSDIKCMVKALSEPMSLYKNRMFHYVCSSPQKAARRHNLLKNFDYVLDDLELEVVRSPCTLFFFKVYIILDWSNLKYLMFFAYNFLIE